MSETLELQQVVCPSCKQTISSFSPFSATVECPYCHNKAFNPLISAKKIPIPERYFPFKTTEKDVEKRMVNELIERDYVPRDIFKCINTGNIIKAYMPMFLYEGNCTSTWNCQTIIKTKNSKGNVETNRIPNSGQSASHFAYLILAYDGEEVPKELKEFAHMFYYKAELTQTYDPLIFEQDPNLKTFLVNTDPEVLWHKNAEHLLRETSQMEARKSLYGSNYVNLSVSYSYDLTTKGRYVLVPFWFLYYTYNNEQYYYILNGLGDNSALSAPKDEEEIKYIKKLALKKKLALLSVLLVIPLYYIFRNSEVISSIVMGFLAIWFVLWIISKLIWDYKKKNRLKLSRKVRSEEAQKL